MHPWIPARSEGANMLGWDISGVVEANIDLQEGTFVPKPTGYAQ